MVTKKQPLMCGTNHVHKKKVRPVHVSPLRSIMVFAILVVSKSKNKKPFFFFKYAIRGNGMVRRCVSQSSTSGSA